VADPRARRGDHPVSVFYQQPIPEQRLVRLCFAKREETLRQAAERLCAI
jgi:methionine aminotransferase